MSGFKWQVQHLLNSKVKIPKAKVKSKFQTVKLQKMPKTYFPVLRTKKACTPQETIPNS
jgi:hypothetical protein